MQGLCLCSWKGQWSGTGQAPESRSIWKQGKPDSGLTEAWQFKGTLVGVTGRCPSSQVWLGAWWSLTSTLRLGTALARSRAYLLDLWPLSPSECFGCLCAGSAPMPRSKLGGGNAVGSLPEDPCSAWGPRPGSLPELHHSHVCTQPCTSRSWPQELAFWLDPGPGPSLGVVVVIPGLRLTTVPITRPCPSLLVGHAGMALHWCNTDLPAWLSPVAPSLTPLMEDPPLPPPQRACLTLWSHASCSHWKASQMCEPNKRHISLQRDPTGGQLKDLICKGHAGASPKVSMLPRMTVLHVQSVLIPDFLLLYSLVIIGHLVQWKFLVCKTEDYFFNLFLGYDCTFCIWNFPQTCNVRQLSGMTNFVLNSVSLTIQ